MKTKILTTMKIMKIYLGLNIKINAANKSDKLATTLLQDKYSIRISFLNLSHILYLHIQSQKEDFILLSFYYSFEKM